MYKKPGCETNLLFLQEVENQEAELKRSLARLLKDLEQGTANKDIPEANDARKPSNGYPSNYVEGSGDNGKMFLKKKDENTPMAAISDKKNPLEFNDKKPPKKEVDIASMAIISKETTVKDTKFSVGTTEKGISTLEQVAIVGKGINMNLGPSNVMKDGKVSIQIDGVDSAGKLATGATPDPTVSVSGTVGLATGATSDPKVAASGTAAETLVTGATPDPTVSVSGTVGPDSAETLVTGATSDPKVAASGTAAETLVTGATSDPTVTVSDTVEPESAETLVTGATSNPTVSVSGTVGPDSAETLVTGATSDPTVSVSGTVGPDSAETPVTGTTSNPKISASGTSSSKDKKMSQTK